MPLATEFRRKIFHNLSLIYLLIYAVLPRWISLILMTLLVIVAAGVEFIRLRRPEVNARLLQRFGGIHREHEIMAPTGILWTLLGCWIVMVVFIDRSLGVTAIGFLVFGDTAAALVGQLWGKHHWKKNPTKTVEGTVAFAAVSLAWSVLFVRPHGAVIGSLVAAWVESLPLPWNDNLVIPVSGAAAIALCFGGRYIGHPFRFIVPRVAGYSIIFFAGLYFLKTRYARSPTVVHEGEVHED